jgi:monovalent cation:H+ antiporter, CPA1 family
MLDIAAICLVATALFAYTNHRFLRLPTTIGVMAIALLMSIAMVILDQFGLHGLREYDVEILSSIDFSGVLMQGMLSFLLFAGALHVDLSELRAFRWQIGILAVLGTTLSTVLVGLCVWVLLPLFGIALPLSYCLVFGALISPTDPVAVLGIMKSAGAPKSVNVVVAGESLFNDGVGVVLFALALSMIDSTEPPSIAQAGFLLLREAGGGLLFGAALGFVTYRLLRSIDSYEEEVLITLATVMGGMRSLAICMFRVRSRWSSWVSSSVIMGAHLRCPTLRANTWICFGN